MRFKASSVWKLAEITTSPQKHIPLFWDFNDHSGESYLICQSRISHKCLKSASGLFLKKIVTTSAMITVYGHTETLVEKLLPAVHSYWPILTKLLFSFVHLANEINESLPWLWHSLLWPIGELELADCPWLAVLEEDKSFSFLLDLITETYR